MFGSDNSGDGILAELLRSQGIDLPQQPQANGLLSMAQNSPYGGLDQQASPQPAMMRAPMPSSLAQSPDMPAMGASNAGPAPMPTPPMPPPRPPGIGTPMALQGNQQPTPEGMQPPQQFADPSMQPQPGSPQQPAADAQPSFGERLTKAFGGLGNIYGAGLPGDKMIELGAALAHPQGMAVGLSQLADRQQRGNALKAQQQLEIAKLQRQQAGQTETAKYLSQKTGMPFDQAFGLVQAGQAGSLISSTVRQPQLVDVRNADGSISKQWRTPGDTSGVNVGEPTPAEKYTDLTDPAARAAAGVPKDYTGSVQRKSDNQLVYPGKASTEVNIGQKGETKFEEEAAKGQAKIFNDLLEGGATAKANLSSINELRNLGGKIGTGGSAALQGWLANNGVKVGPNVPQIEAYGAIIDKLTPAQRIPGSGATSDFDARMFKNSLPGLIRTPEGNEILYNTMEALERDKLARAEIAADVLTGTKTRAEGLRALQALPDPGAAFKAWQEQQKPGSQQSGQAASTGQASTGPLDEARAAIARGAPREAVINRLRSNGIDPSGL